MSEEIFNRSLEDKLYQTKYEPDPHKSHITVDDKVCGACSDRTCTYICPAKVYREDPNNPALVALSHENCLECGTCRQACHLKAIDWRVPDGGIGVKYRFG